MSDEPWREWHRVGTVDGPTLEEVARHDLQAFGRSYRESKSKQGWVDEVVWVPRADLVERVEWDLPANLA